MAYSCAQRSPLSGGEKDILPPVVKKTVPENEMTYFAEDQIIVEFDEFIRLDNIQSQLIVSPLMPEDPEIIIRGKKLVIKIPEGLMPNTTYSINFGDAIRDITEGNIYPNYKYVFSTGGFIDSLTYSGKTIDAFSLQPQENVFVMLYDQFENSVPLTQKPRYIAKSNKEGQFSITNIAAGTYKLFALNDVNSNYLFDLPNEQLGFYSNPVQIASSSSDNKINVFTETNELQYVVNAANPEYGKIEVEMNTPADVIEVKQTGGDEFLLEEINDNEKKKIYWLKHPVEQESLDIIVYENNEPIDTSTIELTTRKEFKDTSLVISTNLKTSFDLNQDITLTFKRPVQQTDTSKIQLLEDSVAVEYTLIQDSINTCKYHVKYKFKEKTNYVFFVEPSTFIDIYGLKNDSLLQLFQTRKESNYGNLILNTSPSFTDDFVLQLLFKDKIKEEKYGKGKTSFSFHYLAPGDYRVKLIVDTNSNKKWDTGNYEDDLQPEQVILYEGVISIQENWDNKIDWVIEH